MEPGGLPSSFRRARDDVDPLRVKAVDQEARVWNRNCAGFRYVLKITLESTASEIVFRLEGKLSGLWVRELERTWYRTTITDEIKRLTVDLSEVTFVDDEGRELLVWICGRGAALKASGCMMKCLVEDIKRDAESRTEPPRI